MEIALPATEIGGFASQVIYFSSSSSRLRQSLALYFLIHEIRVIFHLTQNSINSPRELFNKCTKKLISKYISQLFQKKYKIVQRLSAAPREEWPLALVLQALASAVFVSIFLLLCLFTSICRFLLLCQVFFFFLLMWMYLFEKRLSFHYICSIIGSSQETQFFYHNYPISVTVETCGATVTENNT